MKALLLSVFFLVFFCSYSQEMTMKVENSIIACIAKKARWNYIDNTKITEGATWLHLVKIKDSVFVNTVYSSSKEFDQTENSNFAIFLNKQLKKSMPKGKNVLVRVLFRQIEKDRTVENREGENIEDRIRDLNIEAPYIIQSPIIVMTYGPLH